MDGVKRKRSGGGANGTANCAESSGEIVVNPRPSPEEVIRHALLVFGSRELAERWLARPNRALSGRAPNTLLGNPESAHEVDTILGRIEHGIVS